MSKERENKTNAMRFLDRNHVAYQVHTYTCENFVDGVQIARMLGQNEEESFKTLCTVAKSGAYYVFVLPVSRELDLKKAAKSVNEKSIEMLHVKEIQSITGYIRGGCSPLGMKRQFHTVIDSHVLLHDRIIISGGKLGTQIILSPKDLIQVIHADVTDIIYT